MDTKTTVIKAGNARYLSEFMEDLPDNVFLNKVTTGSGMTSLALGTYKKYVVCVPFRNLVRNKVAWCNDRNIPVLGIYSEMDGGDSVELIRGFKGNKIITTWDSLQRVVDALGDTVQEWKILIDEAHQLIYSGTFRTDAIDQVLRNYGRFGSFVFGTATPVRDKYQLPQLREIPRVEILWNDLEIVNVHYTKYDKDLAKAVAVLCVNYLDGTLKGNAHIFINSVALITSVLRHVKKSGTLNSKDVRIVCADSAINETKLKDGLGSSYGIASINSQVRKLNFYTATAFEGSDIFDESGKTYIISDGSKDHAKIDTLVTLPQIIGRIRNAAVKNLVEIWFTPNRYYSHTTEEQFEASVLANIERAKSIAHDYEIVSEATKAALLEQAEYDAYLTVRDGRLKVNETAWYSEMNAFFTLHKTYYVAPNHVHKPKTVVNNHIDYVYKPIDKVEFVGLNKVKIGKKPNFSALCESYIESIQSGDEAAVRRVASYSPIIVDAYRVLGENKMRALKLRKKGIEEALLVAESLKSNMWKVAKLLDLRVGQWVASTELVNMIESAYSKLGVQKAAKASDISEWYSVKPHTKRVNTDNGSEVRAGYKVISKKFN